MKRPQRILLILVAFCLIGYFLWPLAPLIGIGRPGAADFFLHQISYRDIIRRAKALPIAPGAAVQTTLSGMTLWVSRDQNGLYVITFRTQDLGHFGDYGYTYTDAVLVSRPDARYPPLTTLPGVETLPLGNKLEFVDRKISAHWWSVYNNLN